MKRASVYQPGITHKFKGRDANETAADLQALTRVQQSKPLVPPHRRRDWRPQVSPSVQTCNECGRTIVRGEACMADLCSGHLVRHVGCHEATAKREARR